MPEFAAIMNFEVVYRAKPSELATAERAQALAETMVAVLRASPKVKTVDIRCDSIETIEAHDDNDGLTQLQV